MNRRMKLHRVLNTAVKNGGATLTNLFNAIRAKAGVMVSLQNYETVKDAADTIGIYNTVRQYSTIATQLSNAKRHCYIGLWYDNGKCYIDISVRIKDMKEAIKVGKENNQIGIYNLATAETIRLK